MDPPSFSSRKCYIYIYQNIHSPNNLRRAAAGPTCEVRALVDVGQGVIVREAQLLVQVVPVPRLPAERRTILSSTFPTGERRLASHNAAYSVEIANFY